MPMRKIIKLFLGLCLVFLLTGCQSQPQELTEITFIHGWGSTETDHETMRQIYRDFETENPDIKINMQIYQKGNAASWLPRSQALARRMQACWQF